MVKCAHLGLVLGSVSAVLCAAAVITLIVLWSTVLSPFEDYALVVDAGSTHSNIFLYKWPADKSDGIGTTSRISQVTSCDVTIGAISYVTNPTVENVRNYFNASMTECINSIPGNRRQRALIYLGATAGLRVINMVNSSYVNTLLQSTREYFATLGLLFREPEQQVRIISGSEEGLSGWISTNMLVKQLYHKNQPNETFGVLDMGGASTQISFFASSGSSEIYRMNLFNTDYDVYSHSYLCFGQEQTRAIYQSQLVQDGNGSTIVDDPCLQPGYLQNVTFSALSGNPCVRGGFVPPNNLTNSMMIYFRGTGNLPLCQQRLKQRLDKNSCGPNTLCAFNGTAQPSLNGSSLKFIGMSAFYSSFNTLAKLIPLTASSDGNYDLNSLDFTQIWNVLNTVCNQPWSNLTAADRYRHLLCFYSTYHFTLLQYGYSMNDQNLKNFQMVKMIDSNEIGWTLGYMINQTNYLAAENRPSRLLTRAEFIGLLVCFLVLFVVSLIVIVVSIVRLRRQRRRKF